MATASAGASAVVMDVDGQEPADNYSRVLVIGGGLSGLSAASHLCSSGLRGHVRLLEARQRLGGRVVTMPTATGTRIELGASWLHGVLGNPLYSLAASHGLVEVVPPPHKAHTVAAVTEDGRRLPFAVLQEIYEAYFWFFKRCEEYFLCKYAPPDGVRSVGEHILLEADIYLKRFAPQQAHVRRLIFDYLLKRECCITGCDTMNQVDLLNLGSYTELPGGNITLPRGYGSVLAPIAAAIPNESVLKDHAVKSIHWMYRVEQESGPAAVAEAVEAASVPVDDVSSVASSVRSSRAPSICCTPARGGAAGHAHPNVMVECENGKRFYADFVICTVPLGVLKEKASDLFVPPLPPDKVEAIGKLNFGTVNKIYLEYERPFLSPDISEVILLWDRLPDPSVTPMADRWYRKMYSFCKVSETILVSWISGDEARFMETLDKAVVADVCTAVLRKFLADPYVPKPKSCIFTAWSSQPFSRGSYSSIGVGGQQSHVVKMAEPLFQKPGRKRPVLALAGEHCHPSFYSTGHGAYLSGRSAAQFFLTAAASRMLDDDEDEDVYHVGAASVADLSAWLQEISMGDKKLEDFKRPRRDDGKFNTPR